MPTAHMLMQDANITYKMSETDADKNPINLLIKQLSCLLTGEKHHEAAFRIHNKQLQLFGDLSFQINLEFAAWKRLKHDYEQETCNTIFQYASKLHGKAINEETLPNFCINENWTLKIAKCLVIKANCHVFLDRAQFTKTIILNILSNEYYGQYKLGSNISVQMSDYIQVGNMKLSELRVKILHGIIRNLLSTDTENTKSAINIVLTTKSSDMSANKILCGCVLNVNGQKEETMTSDDIHDEYASNMRMMFEHKYGVRNITENINWREKISKLGHAAVTFQMIQNTPQKTISLASKHHVIKDAAFVLYNGARIKSILRRFNAEFQGEAHQQLPDINAIDFSTLKLNEEWELIYAFLAQFPNIVANSVQGLPEAKLNLHKIYEFLVHFSTAFSTYYSRIKIITEPKEHLLPTLHARIYLLQSIESVLRNVLQLLNIELISQM